MRAMKDSGVEWIGEIPAEWSVKRLKAILQERTEVNNPIKTDFILSLTNTRGVIPYDEKGDIGNKSKEDITGYKLAYPNDIVLNSMNVIIGSVALSNFFGCVSPVYYMLFPRDNKDCVRYYNYIFQTNEFQSKLKGYGNGIMEIRMRIQMSKLNTVELTLPPHDEQCKIADYLDAKCAQIDAIIEKQQQVIEKLKAYKQSVITEAVTKGLDPTVPMKDSGVAWIGMVPEHWEILKFGKAASIKSNLVSPDDYPTYPQISPESIEKGSGRLLQYQSVEESGVISWNHLFRIGQILYSKIRPVLNKVTIAPFNGLCSADMYPINTDNNATFIMYVMLSDYFVAQVGQVVESRVKMPKINQSELAQIYIAIPPISEQVAISKYIAKKCTSIDNGITLRAKEITLLFEYKKSLIYEAVSGKLEVS